MKTATIAIVLTIQVVCAMFFVASILMPLVGLKPIGWSFYELIEIGAMIGLILGIVLGAIVFRRAIAENARMQQRLRVASGAFAEIMEEKFRDWRLTPAESEVALFSIKGLSTQEIAALRGTSEGTIKAQTNAIYRKAGVSGRPQLLSLFIEDLLDGADLTTAQVRPTA